MSCMPLWLDPGFDFDPLAPAFLGRFLGSLASLDYDARHQLSARGSRSGGGGRPRSGGGGRPRRRPRRRPPAPTAAEVRQAKAVLRRHARAQATTSRAIGRKAAKAKAELDYRARVYSRSAVARQRALVRDYERQLAESERQRRRELRALQHFLTPAGRRTPYQRRVVADLTRQAAAGERPSIGRIFGRPGRTVSPKDALADRLAAISDRGAPGLYLDAISDALALRLLQEPDAVLMHLKTYGNPGLLSLEDLNEEFNISMGTKDVQYFEYTPHDAVNPLWQSSAGTKKRSNYGTYRAG
jgi:hypothetical protein